MRTVASIALIVVFAITAVPRTYAQGQHAASQSVLDAAIAQHVSATDAQRQDVLRVLNHQEVQVVAKRIGLDLRRAASAVATMDAEELATLAAQASQVEEALAGGASITLTTTTIIIGLLVLILIIVAVS